MERLVPAPAGRPEKKEDMNEDPQDIIHGRRNFSQRRSGSGKRKKTQTTARRTSYPSRGTCLIADLAVGKEKKHGHVSDGQEKKNRTSFWTLRRTRPYASSRGYSRAPPWGNPRTKCATRTNSAWTPHEMGPQRQHYQGTRTDYGEVRFRDPDSGKVVTLEVTPMSSPPELPKVMKPPESQAHERTVT